MKRIQLLLFCCLPLLTFGQGEAVYNTFKSTRIINTQSVETQQKGRLEVLIGHRFGDMFGAGGGWETFYGLESASDILIGVDYGVTNDLTIGLNRTKGAGVLKGNLNGFAKYRLLKQQTEGMPFSLTALGMMNVSTMNATETPNTLTSFERFGHRVHYVAQVMLARKFSDRFSVQLTPTYIHRNLVEVGAENDIVSIGIAARLQLSYSFALVLDYDYPIVGDVTDAATYQAPLGIGLEIDTGGHIFQINFTNARGMMPNDYIPNTFSNWGDGEFRLGFTITRVFNL